MLCNGGGEGLRFFGRLFLTDSLFLMSLSGTQTTVMTSLIKLYFFVMLLVWLSVRRQHAHTTQLVCCMVNQVLYTRALNGLRRHCCRYSLPSCFTVSGHCRQMSVCSKEQCVQSTAL